LAATPPLISEESWSNTETLDHIIAAAKSPVVTPELRLALSWATVSDPPEPAQSATA
jgi:hypothetical protein